MTHWLNIPGRLRERLATRTGRAYFVLVCSLCLFFLGLGGVVDGLFIAKLDIVPESARYGWDSNLAAKEAPAVAAMMPKFAVRNENGEIVSGAGKSAELWKYAKLVNGGKHVLTWRQQSGDCVSMGATSAVAYTQVVQIANGQAATFKVPFPAYIYGVSRVLIGKRQLGRGAGSIGAWAAQGCISYGVETEEHANSLGYQYSGRLADKWGWEGPPQACIDNAKNYRIKTVSQARSWEDVRDALAYGYPVTVASNVGFEGGSYQRDGKLWLRRRGTWPHQMCYIGMEDRAGYQKGAYILNSWGEDAHPLPLGGEPPGGFWASWEDVNAMVAQGDSWIYSGFDGFPDDNPADWNAFLTSAESSIDTDGLKAAKMAEAPNETKLFWHWRGNYALGIGSSLAVAGLAGCVYGLWATGDSGKPGKSMAA